MAMREEKCCEGVTLFLLKDDGWRSWKLDGTKVKQEQRMSFILYRITASFTAEAIDSHLPI